MKDFGPAEVGILFKGSAKSSRKFGDVILDSQYLIAKVSFHSSFRNSHCFLSVSIKLRDSVVDIFLF